MSPFDLKDRSHGYSVGNPPFGSWIYYTQGTMSKRTPLTPISLNRVMQLEHDAPEQFCTMLSGKNAIFVDTFPMAWRVEKVDDRQYQRYEYVR